MRTALALLVVLCTTSRGRAQWPLSVDSAFQTSLGGIYVGDVQAMPDGNFFVTGLFELQGTFDSHSYGVFNPQGQALSLFGGTTGADKITPYQDKYFVRGGQYFHRWNNDLTIDAAYDNDNIFIDPWNGGEIQVQPDGKVIATGSMVLRSYADTSLLGYNYCLVRLDTNGYPDSTFVHRQCQSGYARYIEEQPDGRFLLSGYMNGYDSIAVGHILRVWPDGSLDTSFHTSIYNGEARDFYTYPDGRILAAGIFAMPELPDDTLHLIRLLPNGDLDSTFPNTMDFRDDTVFWQSIISIYGIFELHPDVLVLTGGFAQVDGMEVGGIVAIDTAGNLLHDQFFTGTGCAAVYPNGSYNRYVYKMEQAPDGSYYIYGSYLGFDDGHSYWPSQTFITRLNALDVGVPEPPSAGPTITLAPNPGDSELLVEVSDHLLDGLLRVTDLSGRVVRATVLDHGQAAINTAELASGVYLVEARNAQSRISSKWIKQ